MKTIVIVGIAVAVVASFGITMSIWLIEPREEQAEQTGDEQKSICKGKALCLNEKVTRIVDGDTIYLGVYKIRISLADTPERDKVGFSEATEFTANLCPVGSTVIVDQDDLQPTDVYGRILGKVFCGNKILNSELLENGHAVILTQYCSTSEFSSEEWAQKYGC